VNAIVCLGLDSKGIFMNKAFGLIFLLAMTVSSAMAIAQTSPKTGLNTTLEAQQVIVNSIYPTEGRLVIDDQEMFVKREVIMNGQSISGQAALEILREGQKLKSMKYERSGSELERILIEVDTL